jgi:hypothetical protein
VGGGDLAATTVFLFKDASSKCVFYILYVFFADLSSVTLLLSYLCGRDRVVDAFPLENAGGG